MQGHISSGMYNRMKEYRRTPINMVWAKKTKDATKCKKQESKENYCPSEDQVSFQRHKSDTERVLEAKAKRQCCTGTNGDSL